MEKNLTIKTATVEIKVIRVDGHKMTKATFNQIACDNVVKSDQVNILGYVRNPGFWILWSREGKLKKCNIHPYYNSVSYITFVGERYYWRSHIEGYPERSKYSSVQELELYIEDNFDQLYIAT